MIPIHCKNAERICIIQRRISLEKPRVPKSALSKDKFPIFRHVTNEVLRNLELGLSTLQEAKELVFCHIIWLHHSNCYGETLYS